MRLRGLFLLLLLLSLIALEISAVGALDPPLDGEPDHTGYIVLWRKIIDRKAAMGVTWMIDVDLKTKAFVEVVIWNYEFGNFSVSWCAESYCEEGGTHFFWEDGIYISPHRYSNVYLLGATAWCKMYVVVRYKTPFYWRWYHLPIPLVPFLAVLVAWWALK